LGVLLFTILSGCFPYRGATDKELYKKIMRAEYRLPSEVQSSLSLDAVNLIKRLFIIDAGQRPTAKEVLSDPWLVDAPVPKPMRSHSNQPA
jgi:serine/threonine protein kinase